MVELVLKVRRMALLLSAESTRNRRIEWKWQDGVETFKTLVYGVCVIAVKEGKETRLMY